MKSTAGMTKKSSGNSHQSRASAADPSQREQMIATAAYYRSEQRSFLPGNELSDWLESESEIDNSHRTMTS